MSTSPPLPLPHLSPVPRTASPAWDDLARLPVPLSSLVGRAHELAALADLAGDPAVRLITLTGPGGVGKTRLALRLAADLAHGQRFADGVALVELAAVGDPGLVTLTIAHALGVRSTGQDSVETALTTVLHRKDLLLVLDNFEHLIAAAARLTDLLQRCPDLTVLVTSRSRLNVAGERVVPLPPLSLPDRAGLTKSEAVRLFAERTRAINPSFLLSDATTGPWPKSSGASTVCRSRSSWQRRAVPSSPLRPSCSDLTSDYRN